MSLTAEQHKLYKSGLVYAIVSYSIWGIFPLYSIGINWFTSIYAVNNNHIVDASLGYYINPIGKNLPE